jgi:hypothetical protein
MLNELEKQTLEKGMIGTNLDFNTLVIESNEFSKEDLSKLPNSV